MRRASHFSAIAFFVLFIGIVIGIVAWSTRQEPVASSVEVQQSIQASLTINSETYTTDLPPPSTVLDLMVQAQEASFMSYAGKEYEGMGFFITTINDIPSSTDNYWIYSVNGVPAQVGVSDYILKPFDLVEWTYEASTKK